MFDYSTLQEFIDQLEKGRRFHISVLFISQKPLNHRLNLSFKNIIHSTPFCDTVKDLPRGLERCMRCKAASVRKITSNKKPFGGQCINGLYEYCHPVIENGDVFCIIFIGNIVTDADKFCRKLQNLGLIHLKDTIEYATDTTSYAKTAKVIESYIRMLLHLTSNGENAVHSNPAVELLKGHIESYFSDDVTLGQVARIYHYNSKYLGRVFMRETGSSFKEQLNRKRIEYACKQLKNTNKSITEIATNSGFNSVTYFNRVFLKEIGVTPSEYRLK